MNQYSSDNMIVSHKHKFIFIKTRKTAGSSIEAFLQDYLGKDDILTPTEGVTKPQNYKQIGFIPLKEVKFNLTYYKNMPLKKVLEKAYLMRKYYQHIPAVIVRDRVGRKIWDNYFKFCFERNPWDKVISNYYWVKTRRKTYLDFDDFIRNYRLSLNYPLYTDYNGEVIVDRVCKFENLSKELKSILDDLGIPFDDFKDLPKIHGDTRKDKRPYQEFFSGEYEKYIDMIKNKFWREIELLGYEF